MKLLNHGKKFIINSVEYDNKNGIYMLKAKITEDTKLLSDEEEIEQNKDDLFAEMKKAVEEFNIEKFSQKEREYFEEKSRAMGAGIRIIEPEEELDK